MYLNYFKSLLLLNLIVITNIFSGEIIIEGKITNNNSPLYNVNIYLIEANIGTTSNSKGEFVISNSDIKINDKLVISYIGFKNDTICLADYVGPRYFFNIEMRSIELTYDKSIQITADRLDITKNEIPHNSITIDEEKIDQLGSSEIADYLKTVTSVDIAGNDLVGKNVQIRGSDNDEVNVYIDGVLINNLNMENIADLSIVSAENIEKMEILKGSNLTLLGHGAFGGVINITTRKNTDLSFSIKGKIGQLNTKYLIGDINIPLSNDIILNYFGQLNSSSPEIEYFNNERFDEKTKNPSIKIGKQNHSFGARYITSKGVLSGKIITYFFNYTKPFWKSEKKNYVLSADYHGKIFSLDQFNISINQLYNNLEYDRQTIGTVHYLDKFDIKRTNMQLSKGFAFDQFNFQLLSEYYHDELALKSKFKDGESEHSYFDADIFENRISLAGVFSYNAINDSLAVQPWKIFVGIRNDLLANGRTDFTNNVGISFNKIQGNWTNKPHISIGKNIKYPTLFENAFLHDITNLSQGDSSIEILEPEINTSIELGLESIYTPLSSFYENLVVDMSFFSRKTTNKLMQRPFDEVIFESQNGNNTTLGYEASINLNNIFNNFNFSFSHLWLSVTNPLLYSYKPKIKICSQIDYKSLWGGYIIARYFYEGESIAWYYDEQNQFSTQRISPFFDFDISVGYKFKIKQIEINWRAAGYNILDNSGYLYYYLKKRYLHTSLSIKY